MPARPQSCSHNALVLSLIAATDKTPVAIQKSAVSVPDADPSFRPFNLTQIAASLSDFVDSTQPLSPLAAAAFRDLQRLQGLPRRVLIGQLKHLHSVYGHSFFC